MQVTTPTFAPSASSPPAYAEATSQHDDQEALPGSCDLTQLARRYGTPLFVVDRARLERSYREMLDAFSSEGLDAGIFYSVKTNPLPDVVAALVDLGAGVEVISEFEMWLAQLLGVDGSRIVVNGAAKSAALLRQSVTSDVALINVESVAELHTLGDLARETERQANIGLRVNPELRHGSICSATSTGSRSSHLGFIAGGDEWEAALRAIREERLLHLRGIHFHIGTGIRSVAPYERALTATLHVWERLLRSGFSPTVIDIGGGFALPTLKTVSFLDAIRLVTSGRSPRPPSGAGKGDLVGGIAQLCSRTLGDFARRHGVAQPSVYVEPGRALSGAAQQLLLTVQAVIERKGSVPCALCDAGAMALSPLLFTEQHPISVVGAAKDRQTRTYRVMGSLPTPLDLIAFGSELPQLSVGDILAVRDVGAYFTSLGNNFAGPRPPVVMIENGEAVLVRRREEFRDMVSRDLRFPRVP